MDESNALMPVKQCEQTISLIEDELTKECKANMVLSCCLEMLLNEQSIIPGMKKAIESAIYLANKIRNRGVSLTMEDIREAKEMLDKADQNRTYK